MGNLVGLMDKCIKGSMRMILNKEMGNFIGLMDLYLKVNLLMVKKKEKELLLVLKEKNERVYGKMMIWLNLLININNIDIIIYIKYLKFII